MIVASKTDNGRIAKNTLYLYLRMIVMMVISLYTSRIILDALGIDNFGIYSVVGGMVAMFSFINGAMANSTVRFITFAIGECDLNKAKRALNSALAIHIGIAAIIVIAAETIGVWFLYNEMSIPDGKIDSAFWVLQLSIAATALAVITLPINSLIVAHEKMSAYAYLSIIDVVAKLVIVYFLPLMSESFRLVGYGLLLLGTQIIYFIINLIYCRSKFSECRFGFDFKREKKLIKEMISFSAWSLFGCIASIGCGQGVNMLLNVYSGVVANAARSIAFQVQGAVSKFSGGFQTAVTPQIIKSYAQQRFEYMHKLICSSAKMSYYLMFILSLPIMLLMDDILSLWLVETPQGTLIFVKIIMITSLIDVLSGPIMKSVDASGRIKKYHLYVGGFLILVFPTSWFILSLGAESYSVFIVQLVFSSLALFLRLRISQELTRLTIKMFVKQVIVPILRVSIPAGICGFFIAELPINNALLKVIICTLITIISTGIITWHLGMETYERNVILDRFKFLRRIIPCTK